jgi:hypothetical protein
LGRRNVFDRIKKDRLEELMAYIAKLKRGNDYIVTSSSETVEGCLEALVTFVKEESGEDETVNLNVEDVEVEYTEIPYVFSAHRNWKGELIKIYGFTIERAREIMNLGGYSSLHLAYALVSNPRVSLKEKEAIFGFSGREGYGKSRPKARKKALR